MSNDRDPICEHAPVGRVTAGTLDGAHASTYVCDREACIDDAKSWAKDLTGLEAVWYDLPKRKD